MYELWKDYGTLWILEQWALWMNQPANINLGYPSAGNGRTVDVQIDDEFAGYIHDSVNALDGHQPTFKNVINLFYVKNRSISGVARELGLSRAKATQTLQNAESWLDARIYDYFAQKKISEKYGSMQSDGVKVSGQAIEVKEKSA